MEFHDDFFLDLLFYHLPEYIGRLNFYLSAVDARIKSAQDHPAIGILPRKGKNKLTNLSPQEMEGSLPLVKQLKSALNGESFHEDDEK